MTRRARIIAFGAAGLLVLAGAVSAAVVGDGLGQILALVLIGLGLVALTSLVFFEVGLSEDRERHREEGEAAEARPEGRRLSGRRRLARRRGQSRRLGG